MAAGIFDPATIAALGAIVVFAFFVRGMTGFGTSLMAIPLMVYVVPIHSAVVLMSLLGIGVLLLLGVRDRVHVAWDEVWRLAVPTLLGVVVGVWVFSQLNAAVMAKLLGVFIVGYAIYMVVSQYLRRSQSRWPTAYAWPFGFLASFVDSVFGGGGGVVTVIYMHGRGYDKIQFRSTLAVLWIGESLLRIGGYAVGGYYDAPMLATVAILVPLMFLGTWLGERATSRISPQAFTRLIATMLAASGASLLLK